MGDKVLQENWSSRSFSKRKRMRLAWVTGDHI